MTGAEARGGGPTTDRPYKVTLTYDALNHLTSRAGQQWDRWFGSSVKTYVNNRSAFSSYDEDGRITSGDAGYTYYDAAGSVSSFGDWDPYKTDQSFDGDGKKLKTVLRNYDSQTQQWTTEKTTYYIYSTVLGGIINEVSSAGAKEKGFVHAPAGVMAIQTVAAGGQYVAWEHYDASFSSYRGVTGAAEMDSFGADAGMIKPLTWPPRTSSGEVLPYYGIPTLNSATSGCQSEGMPIDCAMLTNDNSKQCENNRCGPQTVQRNEGYPGDPMGYELTLPFMAFANGKSGYLRRGEYYQGHGDVGSRYSEEPRQTRLYTNHHSSLPQGPAKPSHTQTQGNPYPGCVTIKWLMNTPEVSALLDEAWDKTAKSGNETAVWAVWEQVTNKVHIGIQFEGGTKKSINITKKYNEFMGMFKGQLVFITDWHTHPDHYEHPSLDDVWSLNHMGDNASFGVIITDKGKYSLYNMIGPNKYPENELNRCRTPIVDIRGTPQVVMPGR